MVMFTSFFIILIIKLVHLDQCYWTNKCPYFYYGSVTPYNDVRGDIRDEPDLEGCQPLKIWMLARHGTRHPSSNDIEGMKDIMTLKYDILESYAKGRGKMCAQDIQDLSNWKWDTLIDKSKYYLTSEGFQELYQLGVRFREKFPRFIDELDEYQFRPTIEQRTRQSARAFTQGLGMGRDFVVSDPRPNDEVIRPYKNCTSYKKFIRNNPNITALMKRLIATNEYQELQSNLQNRLGLNFELSSDNITNLYNLCRFYRAYNVARRSPWCAIFTNEDLELLEYIDDMDHYYSDSYGANPFAAELGAAPLKDLFEKFIKVDDTKSFTGYFSHDTTIEMMYTALGLFQDSDYSRIEWMERKWRTSFIVPFGANFVAILYKCDTEIDDNTYKVLFYINEKRIELYEGTDFNSFRANFEIYSHSNLDFCSE